MTAPAQTRAASHPARPSANPVPAPAREVLSFKLGTEEFGIDIHRVQEIRGYALPTRIADAPHFLKGVCNLRGLTVPIVDLRLRSRMSEAAYNACTAVIIVNLHRRTVGIVVDSVSDVLELAAGAIKPAPEPEPGGAVDPCCIIGLGTVNNGNAERMLILLDIERLMTGAEMDLIDRVIH